MYTMPMAGRWELWHAPSRSCLVDFETEPEVLAFVRDLLELGWKPADLSLMYDEPALEVEDLPPAISGDELARRAEAARSDAIRRPA